MRYFKLKYFAKKNTRFFCESNVKLYITNISTMLIERNEIKINKKEKRKTMKLCR